MVMKTQTVAMIKIKHILIGWAKKWGLLPVSRAERKLAALRMKICVICPYSEESSFLRLINDEARYEKTLACSKCGCPVDAKTIVVDEKCPKGKW